VAYVSYAGGPGASESLHVVLPYFQANSSMGNPPYYNDRVLAHELVHAAMAEVTNMNAFDTWFQEGTAEFVQGADERIAGDLGTLTPTAAQYQGLLNLLPTPSSWATDSAHYSAGTVAVRFLDSRLRANGVAGGIKGLFTYLQGNLSANMNDVANQAGYPSEAAFFNDLSNGTAAAWAAANIKLNDADTGSIAGSDYGGASLDANGTVPNGPNALPADWTPWNEQWMPYAGASAITLQVGANNGQTYALNPTDATVSGLGIATLDVSTAAQAAIATLDQAIAKVSVYRSAFGAAANRLEHSLANDATQVETQSASESRIRDTDMAAELARYSRAYILTQGATAMLAQSNMKPRLMLALLRG
jgi:flagellin